MAARVQTVELSPLSHAEEMRREAARTSLYSFVKEFFEVNDQHPFVDNWHIEALCEHLQLAHQGHIKMLLVTMPQRHMKSLVVSVLFPAWIWVQNPREKFIVGHHSLDLGLDLAFKAREVVRSEKFERWFGSSVKIRKGHDLLDRYRTTAGGVRRMTSVGARITGEGSDYLIIDDPHDTEAVESDVKRQSAVEWATGKMFTRLDQMSEGRRIVTGQRVHTSDVIAAFIAAGGWVHLNLPARYIPKTQCRVYLDGSAFEKKGGIPGKPYLFFKDPRTEPGELLWPQHINELALQQLERTLGPRKFSAFYQQEPLAPEGAMFRRKDWIVVEPGTIPSDARYVRSWDLAATKPEAGKTPDWSVGALIAKSRSTGLRYVAHIERRQESARTMLNVIVRTARRDGKGIPIVVELEPGSASDYLLSYLTEKLPGWIVVGKRSNKKKERRAEPVANQAGNGLWRVISDVGLRAERKWVETFLQEIDVFPEGANDDQVDSVSQGAEYLDNRGKGQGMEMKRSHQILTASETISYLGETARSRFGDRTDFVPPKRWNVVCAVSVDERSSIDGAALYVAMPPAGHAVAGAPFVFKLVTIPAGSGPGEIIRLLEEKEFEFSRSITRRLVAPGAIKLQEAFQRRYKRKYGTWDKHPTTGFAQTRDALTIDPQKPHPIFEVNDVPLQGRPRIYFVVHDAQAKRAWDDRGLKNLLQGLEMYSAADDSGGHVAEDFPALQALFGIASVWFVNADPKTRQELLNERLPDGLGDVDLTESQPHYDRRMARDLFQDEVSRQLDDDETGPFEWRRRR